MLLKVQEVEVLEVLLLTLSMFLKTVILCASLALPSGSAYVFSLSELSVAAFISVSKSNAM